MYEQLEKMNKAVKLAEDILRLSRNTLLVNLRFLDMALSMLSPHVVWESTLLTDGKELYYNPRHLLASYKAEKEMPVRNYLHVVMHCVFRHMFTGPSIYRTYWDLACDVAVECVISELGLSAAASSREKLQQDYLNELKGKLKTVTAEKVYSHLVQTQPKPTAVADLGKLFCADDHSIWYMTSDEKAASLGLSGNSTKDNNDNSGSGGNGNENTEGGEEQNNDITESRQALIEAWKGISERMQTDMETFSKQKGDAAGGMMQNLREVNREKYDYTAFLKKFAVMGEVMKINDDEFDYIFYTYGLKLYKKVPLVEPLEYKDAKRIREFVIAIDTSGSTSGELVQKFVQKTYNILKSTESFFSKINLHIIQCDAEIQEHVKITNQVEFDRYISAMEIHGLGGTDFRPVFTLVDKLIEQREFTNLKGLVYFTDGYGDFPARKPNYETAFVFVDDEYNNPNVPPWAIKLVLQKDEI